MPKNVDDREQTHAVGARRVDRRRVLQLLLGGSSVSVLTLLGVPVAGVLRPLEEDERAATVAFDREELPLWEAKLLLVRGRPVIVVNTGERFKALSAVCTHLGCVIKWRRSLRQFFCPCHGGRFDLDGRVMGGPPRQALAELEVEELPDKVVVRAI